MDIEQPKHMEEDALVLSPKWQIEQSQILTATQYYQHKHCHVCVSPWKFTLVTYIFDMIAFSVLPPECARVFEQVLMFYAH